jgi:hypothetical protein
MRVKLQLVMWSDDGREETVTDIVTLKKDSTRIEHLGLSGRVPPICGEFGSMQIG